MLGDKKSLRLTHFVLTR